MQDPFFFGYGSLVNRSTHSYDRAHPARITGWRRAWRHTPVHEVAFLTAVPAPGERIDGLIAAVPGHDWAALDEREHNYERHDVTGTLEHDAEDVTQVQIYAVPPRLSDAEGGLRPILLSYLDVVVQGYLREFGVAGARLFFETTDGWEAPILDDRAAPSYPRHQKLSEEERRFVDGQLRALRANVVTRL